MYPGLTWGIVSLRGNELRRVENETMAVCDAIHGRAGRYASGALENRGKMLTKEILHEMGDLTGTTII